MSIWTVLVDEYMEKSIVLSNEEILGRPASIMAPGQIVRQMMEQTFVDEDQACRRLGLTPDELHRFYDGLHPVDKELAFRLKEATGSPASYWQNFEKQYRHRLAKWAEKKNQA